MPYLDDDLRDTQSATVRGGCDAPCYVKHKQSHQTKSVLRRLAEYLGWIDAQEETAGLVEDAPPFIEHTWNIEGSVTIKRRKL